MLKAMFNKTIRFTLLFSVLCLCGCAASGKLYKESIQLKTAADPEKARLIFFRPSEFAAGGVSAYVSVKSAESKFVANGGYVLIDVSPREYLIDIRLKGDNRYCDLRFNVAAGENRFFEIRPNSDMILSNAIGAGIAAGFNHALGPGAVSAVETQPDPKKCGGIFFIFPVEQDYALKKLESIRESLQ